MTTWSSDILGEIEDLVPPALEPAMPRLPSSLDWRTPRLTTAEIAGLAAEELREHPGSEGWYRGALPFALDLLDLPRNLVAHGVAKALDMETGGFEKDTFLGRKVWASDILKKGLAWDDGWITKIVGFAGDILIDPLTYLLGGSTKLARLAPWVPKTGQRAAGAIQSMAREMLETGTARSLPYMDDALKVMFHTAEKGNWAANKLAWLTDDAVDLIRKAGTAGAEEMTDDLVGQVVRHLRDQLPAMVTRSDAAGTAARKFFLEHGEWGTGLLHLPWTEHEIRKVIPPLVGKGREFSLRAAYEANDPARVNVLAQHAAAQWAGFDLPGKVGAAIRKVFSVPAGLAERVFTPAIRQMSHETQAEGRLLKGWAAEMGDLLTRHGVSAEDQSRLVRAAIERKLPNLAGPDLIERMIGASDAAALSRLGLPDLDALAASGAGRLAPVDLLRQVASGAAAGEADDAVTAAAKYLSWRERFMTETLPTLDRAVTEDAALRLWRRVPDNLRTDPHFTEQIQRFSAYLEGLGRTDLGRGVIQSVIDEGYVPRMLTGEAAEHLANLSEASATTRGLPRVGGAGRIAASHHRTTRVISRITKSGEIKYYWDPGEGLSRRLLEYGGIESILSTEQFNSLARKGTFAKMLGKGWDKDVFLSDPFVSAWVRKRMSEEGMAYRDASAYLSEMFGRWIGSHGGKAEAALDKKLGALTLERVKAGAVAAGLMDPEDLARLDAEGLEALMRGGDPAMRSVYWRSVVDAYDDHMVQRIGRNGTVQGDRRTLLDQLIQERLTESGLVRPEDFKALARHEPGTPQRLADLIPDEKMAQAAEQIGQARRQLTDAAAGTGRFHGRPTIEGIGDERAFLEPGWKRPRVWADDKWHRQFALPAEIADELDQVYSRITPESTGHLLKVYDQMLGVWKSQALAGSSWPIFNLLGGMTFNLLTGTGPMAYGRYGTYGLKQMWHGAPWARQARASLPGVKSLSGARYTAEQVWDGFTRYGLDGGMASEMRRASRNEMMLQWMARGGEIPADLAEQFPRLVRLVPTQRSFWARPGAKQASGAWQGFLRMNEAFDVWNRFVAFSERLYRGDSLDQAAAFVSRVHPDYHATRYTHGEKAWGTRLFPFYKWMRGSSYTMLTQVLAQRPWGMAIMSKLQPLLRQENGIPRELLPAWFANELGTQITGDDREGLGLALGTMTPHGDAFNLIEPLRSYASSLSPLIRAPLEAESGVSLFTKKPLRKYPGESLVVAMMRENLRPWKEVSRVRDVLNSDTGQRRAYTLWRTLLGGRIQHLSFDQQRVRLSIETVTRMEEIRRAMNSREMRQRPDLLGQLAKEYMDLIHLRARLKLEVPKAALQGLDQMAVEGLVEPAIPYDQAVDNGR